MNKRLLTSCFTLLIFTLFFTISHAQVSWDGGGTLDNWDDPLNWTGNAVPLATDEVTISGAVSVYISGGINAVAEKLTLDNGAQLDVNPGGTLTVDGSGSQGMNIDRGSFLVNNGVTTVSNTTNQAIRVRRGSSLTNNGILEISASGCCSSLQLDGTVNQGGFASITNSVSGRIHINGGSGRGIRILVDGDDYPFFHNYGIIEMGKYVPIGTDGITLEDRFRARFDNFSSGKIIMYNVVSDGIVSEGQFENLGYLEIQNTGGDGITLEDGVLGQAGSTRTLFHNGPSATLNIGSCGSIGNIGIQMMDGQLNNDDGGTIIIGDGTFGSSGIRVGSSNDGLYNFGLIQSFQRIIGDDQFRNQATGLIYHYYSGSTSAIAVNDGTVYNTGTLFQVTCCGAGSVIAGPGPLAMVGDDFCYCVANPLGVAKKLEAVNSGYFEPLGGEYKNDLLTYFTITEVFNKGMDTLFDVCVIDTIYTTGRACGCSLSTRTGLIKTFDCDFSAPDGMHVHAGIFAALPPGESDSMITEINICDIFCDSDTIGVTTYSNATVYDTIFGEPNIVLSDRSQNGRNDDPGDNCDPTDDNDPTPYPVPFMKFDKIAGSTSNDGDGYFYIDMIYRIENIGSIDLDSVSVTDNLAEYFGASLNAGVAPIPYAITGSPTFNPNFDGVTDTVIIERDADESVAVDGVLEFGVTVPIFPNVGDLPIPLTNQARAYSRFYWMGTKINIFELSDSTSRPVGRCIEDDDEPIAFEILPCDPETDPVCNDLVNVSLDNGCDAHLTPDMILENPEGDCQDPNIDPNFFYTMTITDHYGRTLENPVSGDYRGQKLVVKVTNKINQSSCWGYINMEYKYPPQVDCITDTISCFEELPALDIQSDNACGYPVKFEILYEEWVDFDDCHDEVPGEFIGKYIRSVKSSDPWKNSRTCMDTIYVMKETMDSIVCPVDVEIECDDLNTDCAELISSNGVKKYYAPFPTGIDKAMTPKNDADNDNADGGYAVPYIKSLKGTVGHLPLYQDDDCDGQRDQYLNKCTIYADYEDWLIPSCGHSYKIRREWKIVDWCAGRDTICSQYIKVNDSNAPIFNDSPNDGNEYYSDAHDCKAAVYLDVPDTEDCWDESAYRLTYILEYHDPTHPGKKVSLSGDATGKENIHFYLPASYDFYEIKWTASDACWNNDYLKEQFYVIDITPPTPVCDEHTVATVVSIDPGDCWARIFAKDLDDGSHDNCCGELHFAVATMADIEHYTDSIKGYYEECLGYEYIHYEEDVEDIIEAYLECFVFTDYVDLSHSDDQTLVMRVYEACGLKPYDPHVFHGSKHQWFCYQQHDVYALWYTSHYYEFSKYENPTPDLVCHTYGGSHSVGLDWGCFPAKIKQAQSSESVPSGPQGPINFECLDIIVKPCMDFKNCCFVCAVDMPDGPESYGLFCAFTKAGLSQGQYDYGVLKELYCSRAHFYTSYSECMVEVTIDDKTPPVCTPAPDRYVTCDGIPLDEEVWQGKNGTYSGDHYDLLRAHGVCDGPGMAPSPYDDPWVEQEDADDGATGFPGYTCADGYYGGPSHDDYNTYGSKSRCYPDIWGGEGTWNASPSGGYQKNWRPIYCENWLYLDAYDDCDYERYDPYQLFEEPDYEDNCQDPVLSWVGDHEELNECGEGYIKRTWMVEDWAGNQTYCHQKVYVYCRSDFEIKFPADEIVNCADEVDLEPGEGAVTGWPVVQDAECELIAITHHDQIFNDASDACYKILRTWTVIDWCKFNPDAVYHKPDVIIDDRMVASDEVGSDRDCIYRYLKDNGDGYMTYLQVIKIIDTEAPEFVDCATEDIVYDVLACEAEVTETIEATDNCDDVQYTWRLNGETGHGNSVTMTLPLGEYELTWIAHDQCQNADTCVETVVINNIKPPSPICKGIVTVLMPTDPPMVTIWAADIMEKVEDDCTGEENIVVTFDPEDDDSTSLNMTCADFTSGNNTVIVYFIDGDDNVEQCAVTVILQGSAGTPDPCGISSGAAAIEGHIATESTEPVEFVEVELMLGDHMLSPFVTGVDGKFSFNAVPMNNGYAVVPERNDDYKNGVSTFDLVLIQKHILGIEPLDSPYKVIAADINNSESVSAIDLVELRKLILNYYSELPQNSSWRFVDGSHEFADIQNPWGYPEKVEIESLSGNEVADFVAIKVGDVNQSSVPHSLLGSVIRSNEGDLNFEIEDRAVQAGELVQVQIRSSNFDDVLGYQFTLATGGMEVTEVIPGVLNVTESNFGFQNMGEGQVTTSWNEAEGVKASAEEVLFTLVMKSKVGGQLSELLSANSRYTAAEAYNTTTPNLGVALNFVTDGISTADFDLYQNSPNPFNEETVIGFVLPKDMSAELKIYDVTGKTLKLFSGDYVKGYNSVLVNRNEIQGSGVLYYTLETQDYTSTKKMVLID